MITEPATEALPEDVSDIATGAPETAKADADAAAKAAAQAAAHAAGCPAPDPAPPAPVAAPAAPEAPADDAAGRLRAEYAEIAAIAAQAGRLGVEIDAADAMARGIGPDALRRSVLDALGQRVEASAIVSAAPTSPASGDSPIVRRARERAASATRNA